MVFRRSPSSSFLRMSKLSSQQGYSPCSGNFFPTLKGDARVSVVDKLKQNTCRLPSASRDLVFLQPEVRNLIRWNPDYKIRLWRTSRIFLDSSWLTKHSKDVRDIGNRENRACLLLVCGSSETRRILTYPWRSFKLRLGRGRK